MHVVPTCEKAESETWAVIWARGDVQETGEPEGARVKARGGHVAGQGPRQVGRNAR